MSTKLEIAGMTVDAEYYSVPGQRMAGVAEDLVAKWEEAERAIRHMAKAFQHTIESVEESVRPDEAEIEFGLKISGEANWVLGKAAGEANFVIKLSWKRNQSKPAKVS
jgi:predicted component of type VI protein secretion system